MNVKFPGTLSRKKNGQASCSSPRSRSNAVRLFPPAEAQPVAFTGHVRVLAVHCSCGCRGDHRGQRHSRQAAQSRELRGYWRLICWTN